MITDARVRDKVNSGAGSHLTRPICVSGSAGMRRARRGLWRGCFCAAPDASRRAGENPGNGRTRAQAHAAPNNGVLKSTVDCALRVCVACYFTTVVPVQ